MRHSTATACEESEARIRALEEELEACRDECPRRVRLVTERFRALEDELARLQPVVAAARAETKAEQAYDRAVLGNFGPPRRYDTELDAIEECRRVRRCATLDLDAARHLEALGRP